MRAIIFTSIVSAALLAGCVTTHRVEVSGPLEKQTLAFKWTRTGVVGGMCLNYSIGKMTDVSGCITLRGIKDLYTEKDFSFTDEHGSPVGYLQDAEGTVRVDREKDTVEVSLKVKGKDCDLNGRYHFIKMPNQSPQPPQVQDPRG